MTLLSGKDILAAGGVGSYNDFSDLSKIIHFATLTTDATSYDENGFTLTTTAHAASWCSTRTSPAPSAPFAATDKLILKAKDGGLFAMYGISLSGNGSVTFTGTTANGKTVSQTFPVATKVGFANFVFPASFTALSSVTWTPGATTMLATNIVATETFAPATAGPTIQNVPTTNTTTTSIAFNTDTLTINGVASGGFLNGTQFFASLTGPNNTIAQFRFNGDLVFPNNAKVTATGSLGLSLLVANDVIVGTGVSFDVSAVGAQGVPEEGAAAERAPAAGAVPVEEAGAAARAARAAARGISSIQAARAVTARPGMSVGPGPPEASAVEGARAVLASTTSGPEALEASAALGGTGLAPGHAAAQGGAGGVGGQGSAIPMRTMGAPGATRAAVTEGTVPPTVPLARAVAAISAPVP